mgnify:CR=1 FL=1
MIAALAGSALGYPVLDPLAALVIIGLFSFDALNEIIRFQYRVLQRDEISVTFNEEQSADTVHRLSRLPGVLRAEGFLSLPVKLRVQHREKRTAIVGLERGRQDRDPAFC